MTEHTNDKNLFVTRATGDLEVRIAGECAAKRREVAGRRNRLDFDRHLVSAQTAN
jgi:hypothetical protein